MSDNTIERHTRVLKSYFSRRNLNSWDSEDLAQDVILKLLRMERSVEDCEPAYLYTIARTMLIDKYRTDTRRLLSAHCSLEGQKLLHDESTEPEFQLREDQLNEKIRARLLSMSLLQRQTFVENKFKGVRLQDIANRRKVTLSAIEKTMGKATNHIRKGILESECA